MSKYDDTDLLDWVLATRNLPYKFKTYWGSTTWRMVGKPRINAPSFRAAIFDAMKNEKTTETPTRRRQNKFKHRY
jgi:hypothetical protein